MSRLSTRARLTLGFAAGMAVVLAAVGAFLYFSLASSLDETIDHGLEARLADAARGGETRVVMEESFTEVAPRDRITLLAPDELWAALGGSAVVRVPGVEGRVRAVAAERDGRVSAVGASLDDRDEALNGLLTQLLLAAPFALGLASLLGWWLASSGLRLGRLERALERERAFVANASHELRTPLAVLKAELELALRRERSPEELRQAITSAAAETDRLARLAEDLLVLARSDEDGLPLRPEPLDARELLETVAARFRNGGRLDIDAPEGLLLAADRTRLEQALGNLVDNALRHGAGPVRLSATRANGAVELHVVDDGDGFPPAFLPRAFDRFTRADEARSGGGAGLGLAIADVIARAHGGTVGAANRNGRGADVWLTLPQLHEIST